MLFFHFIIKLTWNVKYKSAVPAKVNMTEMRMTRLSRSGECSKWWSTMATTSPVPTVTWPCWSFTAQWNWDATWSPFAFPPRTAPSPEHWRQSVTPLCPVGAAWHSLVPLPDSSSGWCCRGSLCRSAASTPNSTLPETCSVLGWRLVVKTPAKGTAAALWWRATRKPGSWRVWWAGGRGAPMKTCTVSTPKSATSWTGSRISCPPAETGSGRYWAVTVLNRN